MKTLTREVIEQGQIMICSDSKPHPYIIRVLDQNDFIEIMELQRNLIAVMEKKELYVPISNEELEFMLQGHGESLGLFIQDQLYAVCSLLFDVPYENNMARELGFGEAELALVAQLELSLVDPDLRGHKLQHKLAGILANRAEARKRSKYLFTTVSPYNYPSITTVTSLGLHIARLCKMYYNWDRFVVYRDFIHPIQLDTTNTVILPNTAFDEQQQLLNNGYRGFSQFKDEEGIKILYAKII